ncbi:nucleoside-diphosphate kinase [uncultured Ilyobacter sp.]|jgi:nucleoside-diphosphate kinase|uniref:nucleoside-diphosphate kinase n=1 Tax=uncultured Ilyobacter sp. TaxID=544433 RepID=UPI0029C03ABD|nr:nucleoside-diphosphate kinase [uncultured Ilyobacter sp.]
MEKTLLIIKPDGVQRGLVGKILAKIEKKGFKISAMKLEKISEEKAGVHYAEHKGKGFYSELLEFITSSPSVLAVIEGKNVIEGLRKMAGKTNPLEADLGTIRGDFAVVVSQNIVHTSDGPESSKREIENFFSEEEIQTHILCTEGWTYGD